MIKSLLVEGLNGEHNYFLEFHDDLNILTGRNGAGKTTLLKLLWYMTTSLRTSLCVGWNFSKARIETDVYSFGIEISQDSSSGARHVNIIYSLGSEPAQEEKIEVIDDYIKRLDYEKLEHINNILSPREADSVFFPTFRRVEGGFSLGPRRIRPGMSRYHMDLSERLSEAMETFASSLSDERHRLIASISTKDIVQLLMSEYNRIAEETNRLYLKFSQQITSILNNHRNEASSERDLVEELRTKLRSVEQRVTDLRKPFSVLSGMVRDVFVDKGITISPWLSFGNARQMLNSDILSAGEKQMFSFLCYNAFVHNAAIFIDEPELSLHVDWQRILFSKLLAQDSTNQFFVTTHSPFIYTRYPDKEFLLSSDRGDVRGLLYE